MSLNKKIRRLMVLALILVLTVASSDSENKNLFSGGYDLCLYEIGEYMFSEPVADEGLLATELKVAHCELTRYLDSDKKMSDLQALLDEKKRYTSLNYDERKSCLNIWEKQWHKANEEIANKSLTASSVIDMELYYRASLEAAMTAAASVSTYAHNKGEYAKDCNNPFTYIIFARMENIAFFVNRHLFERLLNNQIHEDVHRSTWLIAQHADMDVPFQELAVAQFRKASTKGYFAEKYSDLLAKRLKFKEENNIKQ